MKGSEDLTQGITCLKRHGMVNLVISMLDIMRAGSRRFSSLGYYRIKKLDQQATILAQQSKYSCEEHAA